MPKLFLHIYLKIYGLVLLGFMAYQPLNIVDYLMPNSFNTYILNICEISELI